MKKPPAEPSVSQSVSHYKGIPPPPPLTPFLTPPKPKPILARVNDVLEGEGRSCMFSIRSREGRETENKTEARREGCSIAFGLKSSILTDPDDRYAISFEWAVKVCLNRI